MKCSALFVLANPSYFVVFMFYVVLGGFFGLLIPNDLQCNYQNLNLTFVMIAQNIKMKIELRKK